MESTTILPDSDKVTGWSTFGSGSNHFGRVNDSPDDDSTGIERASSGSQDRYTFEDVPSDFGTSTTIKVVLREKNSDASGRDVTVGLLLNGSQVGTGETKTITNTSFSDIEFTQTAWDAGFWEHAWNECEAVLTSGSGTGTLQISEVKIEINYYKIAILTPNEDGATLEWTKSNSSLEHYDHVDDTVDNHDGDTTYLHAGNDQDDVFGLSPVPGDFDASKKVEVRFVSRHESGNDDYIDVDFTLKVGGTGQGTASYTIDWGSYQLARVTASGFNDKDWTAAQMNGAELVMREPGSPKAGTGINVTAVDVAVSYDTA